MAQTVYSMYKNLDLPRYIGQIEMLSLLVAALGHDLGHPGTTSSFPVASKVFMQFVSPVGPILERHHLQQTLNVLNCEGCDILRTLSLDEHQRVIALNSQAIMATEVAAHSRTIDRLNEMAGDACDNDNPEHRERVVVLVITVCDLSDQTKDWTTVNTVADLVTKEFWKQGDLEKDLGKTPIDMFDREKAYLPKGQVAFLTHLVLPLYEVLVEVIPAAKPMLTKLAGLGTCIKRFVCSRVDAMCMVLRRFSYPNRLCDLEAFFGRPTSALSLLIDKTVHILCKTRDNG